MFKFIAGVAVGAGAVLCVAYSVGRDVNHG